MNFFRAQWREGLLCLSLFLCALLCHCDQINGPDFNHAATPSNDQLTAAGEHGRSLLQNPDRPALTRIWGVDMSSKIHLISLSMEVILHIACDQASLH
jgi:hypothetical protein